MIIFFLIVSVIVGYLLGSINSSIIVGKLLHGKDIREMGSGNAGATNTLRSLGKKAAVFVLVGDIVKGVLACLVGRWLVGKGLGNEYIGMYLAGFAAVIGHNWPVFFGFRGGKGVLTSAAVIFMFSPIPALLSLALFILMVLLWKTVSLGSMVASTSFVLFAALFGASLPLLAVSGMMVVLIIARHHGNIKRLIAGTEPRITDKKKEK